MQRCLPLPVEAAAFAESDVRKLLDIGLSYIPSDCGIARGVRDVVHSYDSGKTWQEARVSLLNEVPGSFGLLGTLPEQCDPAIPAGEMGYDAASNVGIVIIGLLYGEGDFLNLYASLPTAARMRTVRRVP